MSELKWNSAGIFPNTMKAIVIYCEGQYISGFYDIEDDDYFDFNGEQLENAEMWIYQRDLDYAIADPDL